MIKGGPIIYHTFLGATSSYLKRCSRLKRVLLISIADDLEWLEPILLKAGIDSG